MIGTLNIVAAVIVGLPLAYLALLSILASLAGSRPTPPARRQRHFAVVIPAYNEESSIGMTVQSARAIDYPHHYYDVVVVADNCTDRTAEFAREAGARVLTRTADHERSKGHALRWAFDRLLAESYEAFVVCDADSTLSANILHVMNNEMDQGAGAVQCSDLVKPAPGSWSSEATRAGFVLYNIARPLGRTVLGCSAGLRGNGMGFPAETLRRIPWSTFGRAEDLEFGLVLLLNGISVRFAPDAGVLAAMPVDARNAETQRARWEGGRYPVIRRYAWPLLRESLLRRSYPLFDAWTDLVTPPFTNLMFIACAGLACMLAGWMIGIVANPVHGLLWAGAVGCGAVHVVFGFAAAGRLREFLGLMMHVPRYVLWKIHLYVRVSSLRDHKTWVRTSREELPVKEGS